MKCHYILLLFCLFLCYIHLGLKTNAQSHGDLRLTSGTSGLLQVYYNGWGYICDDGWDSIDANTTCKILGYGTVVTTNTGRYGSSTNYKINYIDCSGSETNILDCGYRTYRSNYCSTSEHIYIECGYVNGNLRLSSGSSGLLEVYYNGWGYICDDGWGTIDATTVCKILGYGARLSTSTSRYHSSTNYKLNFINCGGNEASILNCGYSLYTSGYCSSYEHIYVSCGPANGEIRLTGGFSGLLEVYYNGWGFICDDRWDSVDANTTCKILGYDTAISTLTGRYNSTSNYKLTYINCAGTETSILSCGYRLYPYVYCSASEHIYIECGPVNGDVRLTGGDSGLLEVYYNGWGFICDDSWGSVDSNTVCQILGYGAASSTQTSRYHSSTNYKLNYFICSGSETNILNCGHSTYSPNSCSSYEHVFISCGPANGELRLTGGFSGLLEVYYNGWGFICDDRWDSVDANTTCKILGYESAITTSTGRYNSSTNYKLTYINCAGTETSILSCGYTLYSYYYYYCSANEHIYIECGPVNGDVRLTGGDSGLLEVYYNGWGFICDDYWGSVDSNTVCQILGYGAATSTQTSRYHSSTNYKLNLFTCTGNETNILDCSYRVYTPNYCSRYEHIYISCGPANGEIRLTGGFSGLLEVYYNGWGFVCDTGWDTIDANTTCKILGYESVIATTVGRYNSSTNYKLTNINCGGSETSLLDCGYSTYYYYSCFANDHVYVECGPVNGDVRLTGGDSGLLEVYYNGWGFICDDSWGSVDSNTVCQILGYGAASSTQTSRYHSSTNYKLNYFTCSGNETNILDCTYRVYTPNFCNTYEHVFISCGPANGEIRLTGGFSGLLEVYYNGWGFICDDGWGTVDANTTCRILGYETVIRTSIRQYNASTNYKLNYINCRGGETSILNCGYSLYTSGYCSTYEHIYIECGPVNGDLRLTGGDSGLLEVYYNGWGFICDDGWGTVDANTVCKLLGHDTANSTEIRRYHSSTNYKLNYIGCTGTETSILDCSYREYIPNFCSQNEHIYLSCSPAHGELRLTGGFRGLLEVYYNGWGFICDDSWGGIDANTSCRILGYERAITTSIGHFNSSTNYKLNYINCRGGEATILDCGYNTYTLYTCSSREHVYIECGPVNGDLRLAGGDSGLVEVYYNGWGYICDDGWGTVDSNTVCELLGYGAAVSTRTSSYHSSTNYKLNYINCRGNESSILGCGYREYRPNYCSRYEHVYITCGPANGEIRLTGGFSGLLEVYYNGWGFVCDDGWGNVDANTTCKILGYEGAITTSIGRYNYGTNYKLNFINCRGNETNFLDCGYSTYTLYYCSAYEHIYIECGPVNGDVRLTGGNSGILEVYYNGWGYICDDRWSSVDATPVCRQLGYGATLSTSIGRYHSSTNYKLNFINCRGNESSLFECGYSIYTPNYCSQSEHVFISCGIANGEIRLTGGFSGLLEVYYNGWGFICDDGWGTVDANTTCRILGYETVVLTSIRQYNASTNYKLNFINCRGGETSILNCGYSLYTSGYCSTYEHIYIECGPVNGDLRLTGGDSGLLEVYYNGWGFICDDGWGTVDANTVCKLLGHDTANSTEIRRYHSSTNYKLNYIGCTGTETSILDCSYREYIPNFCSQNEHIYLSCTPLHGELRLTGGFEGLLEVFYNGWGFICDDGWGAIDANTTCQILGYERAITTSIGQYNASTNYKLNFINCRGNETRILSCGYRTYVTGYCSTNEHIYIQCGPVEGDLRLTGGDSGLLEVYYNGWGFICDDGWNTFDANSVCKLLGHETANSTEIRRYHSSTNYKLNYINCTGTETSILDCSYREYTPNSCSQNEHIYLSCTPVNGDLRLTGGRSGLLEVYYNGWGFICDDGWDNIDAVTVCQILGYQTALTTSSNRYNVSTNYKLFYINCQGNESSLLECAYINYIPNFCSQYEHIYIECGPVNGQLRLTSGDKGLLEVYYNDSWGFICDDGWDVNDATAVCQILGYDSVYTTSLAKYNVSTNYKINYISCRGNEASILDCGYREYVPNYCSASEHIYVDCGPANGEIRLTLGNRGLLEVYYDGWGFICHDGWGAVDSTTVCQILGYSGAVSTSTSRSMNYLGACYAPLGVYNASTNYKLNFFNCLGSEINILECGYSLYTPNYCSQSEHVYINCGPKNGDIRLNGGDSGLLEVYYNGWGFICDDGWGTVDATTVCQILGYRSLVSTRTSQYNTSRNYKINYIGCLGNESNILDCSYRTYVYNYCSLSEHIFVQCRAVNGDLRLTGGDSGLVEVYYNGWGFICDDGWDNVDSNVTCQILGHQKAVTTSISRYYGSTNYKLNNINCRGGETGLLSCGYRTYTSNSCTNNEHIYIACGTDRCESLLPNTNIETIQAVQYYQNRRWYYICGDVITESTAKVICRENGYGGIHSFHSMSRSLASGSFPTYPYRYECSGNEQSLCNCTTSSQTCRSYSVAAVECLSGGTPAVGNTSPFSQFTTTSYAEQCLVTEQKCHDLVFLVDISGSINTELNNLIPLARNLSDYSGSCTNRYGLTTYGSDNTTTTPIAINGTSYFGSATDFNTYLQALSSLSSSLTSVQLDAYVGIHKVVESYPFREGVERKLVLITSQSRHPIATTLQYTYENTLLLLTSNNITLSVMTNGVQYYGNSNKQGNYRLVGMTYNDQIGFGNYSNPSCSISDYAITSDVRFSVQTGYELIYKDYVELAWNTNGTSFDLTYHNVPASSYCSAASSSLFSQSILQGIVCDPQVLTYSYASKTRFSNGEYTRWSNIVPRITSNCVDMVFLIDRSGSMQSYRASIRNLTRQLPENGDSCVNRYGLAIFAESTTRVRVGTGYWGTPSQLYAAITYSYSGSREDGFIGINYVLRYYTFRSNVQKHIVLFADEDRSVLSSTLTKSSLARSLENNEITLSVVSNAEDFNYRVTSNSISPIHAAVKYSSTKIGFKESSIYQPTIVDAFTPVYSNIHSTNRHNNYVDLAWSTEGVAFNLDYYLSSANYVKNSAIFNKLMFSYSEKDETYKLLVTNATSVRVSNNVLSYVFTCETNNLPNTSISLVINERWYTQTGSGYISVTAPLWNTLPGTYNFLCLANNTLRGNVWLGSFVVPEIPISPFIQFVPNYIPRAPEITCDTFTLTSCVDLIFVIDVSSTMSDKINRTAYLAGSLKQSYSTCTNRYGLTIIGSSNLATTVNIATNSQFGTPAQLRSTIESLGPGSGAHDGYVGIHQAIANYQFRNGVQRKMVLFADQPRKSSPTVYHTYESTLVQLLKSNIILSVVTYGDTYSSVDSQERLIGMTASNRIGYGNYSSCSTLPVIKLDTVLNAQYTIRNASEHYSYVELAWTTGGASYDMSYFESSHPSYCFKHLTDVFSFATLADTPCTFNGAVYTYNNRSVQSTYTQWGDITAYHKSSCVDMVFVVDRTGSMNSYYGAIRNVVRFLPTTADTCHRFGLTVFRDYATYYNLGGTGIKWGTRNQLYSQLLTFTVSGSQEDGLKALDYVISRYTFRTNVEKHIVLFADEPRAIISTSVTKSSVLTRLLDNGIILSAVTPADYFYTYGTPRYSLLAEVELSNTLIGFGQLSGESRTNINAFSPSQNVIRNSNSHTNYVDLAWLTGGVAFDMGMYSGSSKYVQTSTVFNKLLFSYGTRSNFSIPHIYEPFRIIATDVETDISINSVEYTFSCSATFSPGMTISLIIDGEWYTNTSLNFSTHSVEVKLGLTYLTPGLYSYVCVANSSLGADSQIANYTIVEIPIYPFQQFGPSSLQVEDNSCGNLELTDCLDLVFIMEFRSSIGNASARIMELVSHLPDTINNCTNRYGLTIYGLANGAVTINVTSNSYFGSSQQLKNAIQQNLNISMVFGSANEDGYGGIYKALDSYKFRSGVKKRIVLFADDMREKTTRTEHYNYEDTLLLLLQKEISLSIVSNGAKYYYSAPGIHYKQLIGINYNTRIGFGIFESENCTSNTEMKTALNSQYSVSNSDIYVSYIQLAWSTNGAALDLNYLKSANYCPSLFLKSFIFGVFSEVKCDFAGEIFSYTNLLSTVSYKQWRDINPQAFSNCVDMVLLVDRTGSMNSYYTSIANVASRLPTRGDSCDNRYGLTLFHSSSVRYYVGGGSKLFGTPTQLASRFPISQTGATEDGLKAIDYVINNYRSSFRSSVQKHIVLFTDEPRSVVTSSITKLTVLNKLTQYGIILSVVTNADDFYSLLNGTRTYYLAAIQISNTRIGFAKTTDPSAKIDALSPIITRQANSNTHTNYVDLSWETGGVAFDLGYYSSSSLRSRTSTVFNKLMFSWGGRQNSSISSIYAPVLVTAINSTAITTQTGQLVHRFACMSSSSALSNISLLVDGKWYSELSTNQMEQSITSNYPFPHPGSYNFICVANNSIGGDQTLGVYTVPDTPRVYQQYSQFTYIPDSKIHCGSVALESRHCVDAVFVVSLSDYSNALVRRISSLAASLPTTAAGCTNRYGLTVYGSANLSEAVSLTTQGYKFGSPSQLGSAVTSQKIVSDSSGAGLKDGYEAIAKVMKEYSFRMGVQKKIILFADEQREIDTSSRNLTFTSTLQLLLTNGITLNTISNADSYQYYYNNSNNRLIGMHYNSRTGIGNYSASCGELNGNLGVVPSAEYKVSNLGTHHDYVELAWKSNGSTFDLDYFKESNSSFCSTLLEDIFQFGIIQNFPCTLTIVDYAFTTRTQYPSYIQWQDIQPQVQSTCVDMVFLLDISGSMSSYRSSFRYLANNLPNNGVGCSNKYGLTRFERTASAYTSSSYRAERGGYFFPSDILYSLIPSYFYGGTEDGFVGIQYIIDNYRFRTNVVKSIVLLTDEPRSVVQSRYTKSSILSALQSNGIILSVITNAEDFSPYGSSSATLLAASYVKQTLIGFGYTGSVRTIIDAISPVRSVISNNNTHNNYVDIAWQTGGVAFNLDYYRSSYYYSSIRNSFNRLMYIWGDPAPLKITTLSFEFQGTFSNPSPYQFTCSINSVPHATLKLIIEGNTYTQTDTTSISQTLHLLDLQPGTYQFICMASNSNGGDSKVGEFTIKEPIPSPFSQFAYIPDAGHSCNTFTITNCVDLIFIVDISASINNELNRIAELAGNLPETSGTCSNRYGLVLFGVTEYYKIQNLTTTSLYGTPTQLKSAILNSANVIVQGPEDGYPAIHAAVRSFEIRNGAKRKFILFADERRQPDSSSSSNYTYENTISLLLSNDITLSVVSYLGIIQYHNQASRNRLIGMKFFNNIGFGNFSSNENDSDLAIVSTPYFIIGSSTNIYHSYVFLAWDTKGSAFDMRYFYQFNYPYFPRLLARLFEFAVVQDVPCQFTDLAFNFNQRYVSSTYLYSRWTDITTQIQSDCVDMVFLVDRTGSMSGYLNVIRNLANNLPENGANCNNRYGLVSFERTAIIFNIGGSNVKFGTSRQLYTVLSSFSLTGGTEDGYVGIDAILREYRFRESTGIRKHIVLFTDEPRSIVNSSLTKSYILNKLGEEGFILSVVTNADYFRRVGSTSTRMVATAVVSKSYVGFRNSFQQFIDAYSPVTVSKLSTSQHNSYVDLAWKTGGVAFDLAFFTASSSNRRRTVETFQKLMYSWGIYVPLKINSINSEVKGDNIEVTCTTNNVPNVSISLIASGQRFSEFNAISLSANISLSSIDTTQTLDYVCLANNSIGGDSSVDMLNIQIEHGPPTNAVLTVQSSTSILVEWSPPISSLSSLFTYTVFYSANLFDLELKSTSTGPGTTRLVLMNLTPYTVYSVYIRAVTHFDSNQTEVLTARTFQQAPTAPPQNATVTVINSTSLLVQWSPPPPAHQNGPISSYILSYPSSAFSDAGTSLIEITIVVDSNAAYPLTTTSQYQLNDLNPFNLYNINITARNGAGLSPQASVTARTDGTAPTQSPQNVIAVTLNSTAIRLTWSPPSATAQNGILTSYQIHIEGSTFDTTNKVAEFSLQTPVYPTLDSSSMLLAHLEEYNQYYITVVAVNSHGTSSPSSNVSATTSQSRPSSSPKILRISTITATSINISWYPPTPINQNGIITKYAISYQKVDDDGIVKVEIESDSMEYPQIGLVSYVLRNLEKEANYSIRIEAVTSIGIGVASFPVYHYTRELLPGQVQSLNIVAKTSTSITLSWKAPILEESDRSISAFTIKFGENIESLENRTIPISEDDLYTDTISNLSPQTLYLVRVYASNIFGKGEDSDVEVRTNPADSAPEITNPDSNTTMDEDLSTTFNRTIVCRANGYPQPTIRWYSSEGEIIVNGETLYLTVSNVSSGKVYICKAENRIGFMSRSVQINIIIGDPITTLNDIGDEINTPEFDPNTAGDIADTIKLALPSTDNVPIKDINKTREILDTGAKVNEELLDKIIENDTALPLDDAGKIVDTAADIAVKDTELDAGLDSPTLTPEEIKQGIVAFASDSLFRTLRTIEKVCRNLGNSHMKNDSKQETITITGKYINIFGANLPLNQQPAKLSLPLNPGNVIEERVELSQSTMLGLADGDINVKIFVATLNLDSALLIRRGTGTKHASSIVLVVIPKILTNVSLSKEANITLPTILRSPSTQSGTYLRGTAWVKSGIITKVISESITELVTQHFTPFALFDTPLGLQLDIYLSIASYVLSSLSILFLILSILLFIFATRKGFFKVEINILYFNLALALLIAQTFFALYGIRANIFPEKFCKTLAGIIHCSWIAVFTWCLAFVIYLFYKLTCGINKHKKVYPYLIIISWVLPFVSPIFTIAFKLEKYIDIKEHCFPSIEDLVVVGLAGPILILSFITLLMIIFLTLRFISVKKRIESEIQRADIKHILVSTAIFSCFLLIPWIALVAYILFGYFEVKFLEEWIYLIEWVFVLLNDLMGIIFFFSIVVRNRQVILLITRKQPETETEIIQRDVTRRDVIHNPTYGDITNFGIQNMGFNDSIEKNPDDLCIYADIGEDKFDKVLMEKQRAANYNPYDQYNTVTGESIPNQMFDSDLPPVYDQVTSKSSGFYNPVYGMGGEVVPEEPIYQAMHFADNPCLEDLKPEEELSPIHPTGMRIEKENDYEI